MCRHGITQVWNRLYIFDHAQVETSLPEMALAERASTVCQSLVSTRTLFDLRFDCALESRCQQEFLCLTDCHAEQQACGNFAQDYCVLGMRSVPHYMIEAAAALQVPSSRTRIFS